MTSRREFIRVAGGSLAGLAVASSSWARMSDRSPRPMTAIAESFIFDEWRNAMDSAVTDHGNRGDRVFWTAARSNGIAPPAAGALLVLPAPGVELFEAGQARDLAALANDRLADRVRISGGTLAGLATLSPRDRNAAYEAERAISRLGLCGLALGANRTMRLDDRSLWPLYDYAEGARVAIYLPASYAPVAGDLPYRALGAPGILAGAAADSARHATQLIFGGVLDAFPRLNVVLARLGEGTPYWHGEMSATYAALQAGGGRLPRRLAEHYFETNIALTTADMRSTETLAYCDGVMGCRVVRSRDGDDAAHAGPAIPIAHAGAIFRTNIA